MLDQPANSHADDFALAVLPIGSRSYALVTSNRTQAVSGLEATSYQRAFSGIVAGPKQLDLMQDVPVDQTPIPYGAATYCAPERRIYFAAKADNEDARDFDLYTATIVETHPELRLRDVKPVVALNKSRAFDSHPTLSKDGTVIYFTSDRPGGIGGTDIWYSRRTSATSDNWSTPQALGSTINTLCDEITPFVNQAGRLIFASNGHSTVGGYDLFESKPVGENWDLAQNLGRPVNTPDDEFFPYAATDSTFYYASDQPASLQGVNLFVLRRTGLPRLVERDTKVEEERRRQDSIREDRLTRERAQLYRTPARVHGKVTRGDGQYPAKDAELFVRDNETQEELKRERLDERGEFSVLLQKGRIYDVGAESEESFYDVRTFDLRNSLDTSIALSLDLPDTLVLRINFPFDDYSNPYEFVIGDNGEKLPISWRNSLDLVAQSAKRSVARLREIVIIGHTDSMGSDAYNEKLGERRANFIQSELIKRGVPQELLRTMSMGRRQPVTRRPNEDDEVYRLRCRRAEFVKVFK